MKLKDITDTGPLFWRMLGEALCNRVRKRVQKRHKNVMGQKFQKYEPEYAKNKIKGNKDKLGIVGESQRSFSKVPDMTLTGKTMDDLLVRSFDKESVTIGWAGTFGAVVDGLAGKKNYQIVDMTSDEPLSKDEMEFAFKELNKRIDKNTRQYTSKIEVIRIQ
jgi:hypothetical protein